MTQIMCSMTATSTLCFLYSRAYSNTRVAYPEMTQKTLTYDTDQTKFCQCANNQDDHWNCQRFSFEIGIIEFAEREVQQFLLWANGKLLQKYDEVGGDDLKLQNWFFNQDGAVDTNSQDLIQELCPNKGLCTVSTMYLHEGQSNGALPIMNGIGFSLGNLVNDPNAIYPAISYNGNTRESTFKISCSSLLYQQAAFDRIRYVPPASLIAPYKSCRMTISAAVLNTIGNANNVATAIASLFLSFFLVYSVRQVNKVTLKKECKIRSTSDKLEQQIESIKINGNDIDNLRLLVEELLKESKDAHRSAAAQRYYEHKAELMNEKNALEEADDPKFKDLVGDATETFVGAVFG